MAVLVDTGPFYALADAEDRYHEAVANFVVMAMTERLKIQTVLTFDHRAFRLFRPTHCKALRLVPD
jgi:predicted nucleic acid-binding protein